MDRSGEMTAGGFVADDANVNAALRARFSA
jgi:hypothetical protein